MQTSRLVRLRRVLFIDAAKAWITLGGLLGALLLSFLATCSPESRARYSGFILQFFGIVVVAIGIRETRRLFNKPSLLDHLSSFFADLRMALKPVYPVSAAATFSAESLARVSASATLTVDQPTPTIEQRVAALEKSVEALRKHVDQADSALRKEIGRSANALAVEQAARQKADADFSKLLEAQAAGGLTLEMMGLVWLLAGTILTAFSQELARIRGSFPCLGF